jgi:hypothetical protein
VPLGIAFFLRSLRGEKIAGLCVVVAIFVFACGALYATIVRIIDPEPCRTSARSPPLASPASSETSSPPRCGYGSGAGSRARR